MNESLQRLYDAVLENLRSEDPKRIFQVMRRAFRARIAELLETQKNPKQPDGKVRSIQWWANLLE